MLRSEDRVTSPPPEALPRHSFPTAIREEVGASLPALPWTGAAVTEGRPRIRRRGRCLGRAAGAAVAGTPELLAASSVRPRLGTFPAHRHAVAGLRRVPAVR